MVQTAGDQDQPFKLRTIVAPEATNNIFLEYIDFRVNFTQTPHLEGIAGISFKNMKFREILEKDRSELNNISSDPGDYADVENAHFSFYHHLPFIILFIQGLVTIYLLIKVCECSINVCRRNDSAAARVIG